MNTPTASHPTQDLKKAWGGFLHPKFKLLMKFPPKEERKMTPQFMQPNMPSQYDIECEICYLQDRIEKREGMIEVLQYALNQQRQLLEQR